MKSISLPGCTAIMCCLSTAAEASMIWNESNDGDLSDSGLTPTELTLNLGSNLVLGSTGNAGQGIDRDYFRFTVPVGAELTSIMVLTNTFVSGSSSFIGIQEGPQLTVSPTGAGAENLLGFSHYSNDQIGQNILPTMYPRALPSGMYSVWVQETGGPTDYGFDFVITPVPLPGALAFLLSGLFGLSTLRLRPGSSGR